MAANEKNNAKETYIEILLAKNNFYSILALNTIIEKNLISNKGEILKYFEILEKWNVTKEQKNLIKFKKALYLIKESDTKNGNNLLKDLIDNNSSLKVSVDEIIFLKSLKIFSSLFFVMEFSFFHIPLLLSNEQLLNKNKITKA